MRYLAWNCELKTRLSDIVSHLCNNCRQQVEKILLLFSFFLILFSYDHLWPILSMRESIRSHGSCINQNKYPFPRTWLQLQWYPCRHIKIIRKNWPLPLYYIYFEIAQFSLMIITTVVSEGISLDSWGIVVMEQVALEEINAMISASQTQNNSSKCIIEYLCLANAK